MRTKKNQTVQRQMCGRLVELLDRHLQISDAEAAEALGYRDASILWKVRRGSAFLDVEKLVTLADLGGRHGRANIHWLVSGSGPPLFRTTGQHTAQSSLNSALSRLSPTQLGALEAVIAALLPPPTRKPKGRRGRKLCPRAKR